MALKYTHDVVATTGEYTNGAGEKKKEYTNVGKAFTDDQGRISIIMKTIPVGPNWSGWLSLYPAKDRDGESRQQQRPAQWAAGSRDGRQNGARPPAQSQDDESDDIPF